MNDKIQLMTMLKQEFTRWVEFLKDLDEDQITDIYIYDNRATKDIVAHLAAWQQVSLARLNAALKNTQPEYPVWFPGTDPQEKNDLDQMNAWIHGISHSHPWFIIRKEWQQGYQSFIETAEKISETDLLEVGKYPWLKDYPLSAVLHGSGEHHKQHLDEVIDFMHRNGGTPV
jgi:hypothetical protein